MDGGIAVTKVARLRPLLGFIARNGFEHHVAMVRGHHAEAVNEAITRYLKWPIYQHTAEAGNGAFPSSVFRAG
jgi:L-fucose isomerase-like protein